MSSRPPFSSNLVAAALLAIVTGCAPAAAPNGAFFSLDRGGEPVPVSPAGSPAAIEPSPSGGGSAAPTPASGSGGGASGGGMAPAPLGPTLLLADGRRIVVPEGGEVTLPAGTSGTVTLFMPGRVPSTLELGGDPLPQLHPRDVLLPAEAAGTSDVSGALGAPQADVAVSYMSPGRRAHVGATTGANGIFNFSVAVDAPETGLLVARDNTDFPALALAPVTIRPNETIGAPALSLTAPIGLQPPAPAAPSGMSVTTGSLRVAVGGAAPTWMTVLAVPGGEALPDYALPGVTFAIAYEASSPDGTRGSTVTGEPGPLPAFLAAPNLGGLPATLRPGMTLGWPKVAGASLYTVRLSDASTPESPLWEAASTHSAITLPAGVAIAGHDLMLQVQAWDAPEVTPYSVASIRRLRIPADLPGPAGRNSRAIRRWTL